MDGRSISIVPSGEVGIFAEILAGFHFALLIGEKESLGDIDIPFGEVGGAMCVAITIRGSKHTRRS